jgi:transposase
MKPKQSSKTPRRVYPEELKKEAVQMLLDGHSAISVAENLGLPHTSLLYRWKGQALDQAGTAASAVSFFIQDLAPVHDFTQE